MFTTFSGPIRSGTNRYPPGDNTGLPILTQSYTISAAQMLQAPAALSAFYLPAGSKILNMDVEVLVALTTATNVGLTAGVSTGTANFYFTTFNTGATVGRVATATIAAAQQVVNTNNVGTADVIVTLTPTAATGNAATGSIVVTLSYIQRAADGSQEPSTFQV